MPFRLRQTGYSVEARSQTTLSEITRVHDCIDACRVCGPLVPGFIKPPSLDRGEPGRVMIVGQGPGKAEISGRRAFAGPSGRTLEQWLVAAGADARQPRGGIYFTSVIKCLCPKPKYFDQMATRCSSFLYRQIVTVRPELLITLGREAFEALRATQEDYEHGLCTLIDTSSAALVMPFGFHLTLMHWPHPSGLNRWQNNPQNRARLEASFRMIHRFLGGS